MGQEDDLHRISQLAGQAADAMARGSTAGLAVLLTEMKALCSVLPGEVLRAVPETSSAEAEARARAADAKTEAMFDNLPL